MGYRGVSHAKLLLYGTNKPKAPTWLRTNKTSGTTGGQTKFFDWQTLTKDGLVAGSVTDLLTRIKMPLLQSQLQKGVADVLGKMRHESKMYPSAAKLGSVNGWFMPYPNDLCLVHEHLSAGSVRSTKEFGEVRLQRWATSSICQGIDILECFMFFVGVFSK